MSGDAVCRHSLTSHEKNLDCVFFLSLDRTTKKSTEKRRKEKNQHLEEYQRRTEANSAQKHEERKKMWKSVYFL